MKNSVEITVRYQFLRILLMQAAASGIALLFGIVAFWYFLNMSIVKEFLSVIFMTVNFAMLYSSAKTFAKLDNKPYTPLKPNKMKGVMFGCMVALVTLIITAAFKIMWLKFGNDTGVEGTVPAIINMLFYYWSFPFNGILGLNAGRFMIYTVPVMIVVPIAATSLGYMAGCKNFNISEKINEFMYEKE